ncbi:MAG TPA: hypothetical protein VJ777_19270 [Mycobacterium sp.]|nr:hypothetical protein [Mycobacterium sp.]
MAVISVPAAELREGDYLFNLQGVVMGTTTTHTDVGDHVVTQVHVNYSPVASDEIYLSHWRPTDLVRVLRNEPAS